MSTVSQNKDTPPNLCPYVRRISTDLKKSFAGTLCMIPVVLKYNRRRSSVNFGGIFPRNIMYEQLTKCPNFTWHLPEKYFPDYFQGGGNVPAPRLLCLWLYSMSWPWRIVRYTCCLSRGLPPLNCSVVFFRGWRVAGWSGIQSHVKWLISQEVQKQLLESYELCFVTCIYIKAYFLSKIRDASEALTTVLRHKSDQCRIKTFGGPGALRTTRPPKIQLGVWGSAVSSPSGVWGGAPAEIEFGVL